MFPHNVVNVANTAIASILSLPQPPYHTLAYAVSNGYSRIEEYGDRKGANQGYGSGKHIERRVH